MDYHGGPKLRNLWSHILRFGSWEICLIVSQSDPETHKVPMYRQAGAREWHIMRIEILYHVRLQISSMFD